MGINIDEYLITLKEAAQYVPRENGKKVHLATLYRWSGTGCRGIVLETLQAGATRVTSREAIARFFDRLTAQAHGREVDVQTKSSGDDTEHETRVIQQLDEAGL